jgi:hypothetical protein
MPDLPQFTANRAERGLQTNNVGMEAFAQEGRRVGTFYHQIGEETGQNVKDLGEQWEEHVTFQQQGQGIASGAAIYNQNTQALDQVLKDPGTNPGDPGIITRAMQQYDQDNTKWMEGFTTVAGQRWAAEYAARQRDDFQKYAIGQLSHAAGFAALQDNDRGVEQHSAAAFNDYTSAPNEADKYETFTRALTSGPTMKLDDAKDVEGHVADGVKKIYLSGAAGAIYKTSNSLAALKAYEQQPGVEDHIGSDFPRLEDEAEEQDRRRAADADHAQVEATKQLHIQGMSDLESLRSESTRDDGHGGIQDTVPQNAEQRLNILRHKYTDDPAFGQDADALENRWRTATQDAKDGKNPYDDTPTKNYFMSNWGKYKKGDVDLAQGKGLLTPYMAEVLRGGSIEATHDPREDAGMANLNQSAGRYRSMFGQGPQDPNGVPAYNDWYSHVVDGYLAMRKADPTGDPDEQVQRLMKTMIGSIPGYQSAVRGDEARGQTPNFLTPPTGAVAGQASGETTTATDPNAFLHGGQ